MEDFELLVRSGRERRGLQTLHRLGVAQLGHLLLGEHGRVDVTTLVAESSDCSSRGRAVRGPSRATAQHRMDGAGDNPFVQVADPKETERQALLQKADAASSSRSSSKKLLSLAVFMSVLIIGTISLLSSRWSARRDSSSDSASASTTSSGCDEDYEDYTVKKSYCNKQGKPVLEGADVVAYFASGAVNRTLGSSDYTSTYRGYTFYFSSAVNLELFEDDPDAYAPKYGGFCAFGLSGEDPMNTITTLNQLSTVPSNPDVFTIYDGQLYIFRGEGAKDLFLEDIDELIDGADSLWGSWFGTDCDGFYDTMCFSDDDTTYR